MHVVAQIEKSIAVSIEKICERRENGVTSFTFVFKPNFDVSRVRNSPELGKDTLAEADETRGRRDETDKRPRWLRGKKVLWLGVLLFFLPLSFFFFFFSFRGGSTSFISIHDAASLNMHREKQGRDRTYLKLKSTAIESSRENDYKSVSIDVTVT